jgi:ABC-2 type transport system permease protein
MSSTITIVRLTWLEARRRRIVLAALLGGIAFIVVFGVAVHYIFAQVPDDAVIDAIELRMILQIMTLAGLYVVNFLAIAVAILLPVDTLSGEIASGVMQTLASKPIRRHQIVIGKWLAYASMLALYLMLMVAGITGVMWLEADYVQTNLGIAVPIMFLGALVMATVAIAGGVKLTTITNGMVAFALYGIAFIGGWIEQIGAVAGSDTARRIGTAISLVSPSDAMWRRAAHDLQPPIMRELQFMSPFGSSSLPSNAMIVWTVAFVIVTLLVAILLFRKRPL